MSDKSVTSGPTVLQAVGWGFCAAAGLSLLGYLGQLLSEDPVEVLSEIDPLKGLATPQEMNLRIDEVLALGTEALARDAHVLGVTTVLLALLGGFALLQFLRVTVRVVRQGPPGMSAATLWSGIGLCVVAFAGNCALYASEDDFLASSGIQRLVANQNTRPRAVSPGDRVGLGLPTTIRSVEGHFDVYDFELGDVIATLVDGQQAEIVLADVTMDGDDREPGMTDIIRAQFVIDPDIGFTLPADPSLEGSIVSVSVSANVGVLKPGARNSYRRVRDSFTASTSFRVARDAEAAFAAKQEELANRLFEHGMYLVFLTIGLCVWAFVLGVVTDETDGANREAVDEG